MGVTPRGVVTGCCHYCCPVCRLPKCCVYFTRRIAGVFATSLPERCVGCRQLRSIFAAELVAPAEIFRIHHHFRFANLILQQIRIQGLDLVARRSSSCCCLKKILCFLYTTVGGPLRFTTDRPHRPGVHTEIAVAGPHVRTSVWSLRGGGDLHATAYITSGGLRMPRARMPGRGLATVQ